MRRVLVTGASGFLGQHLCAAFRGRLDFVAELQRDGLETVSHISDLKNQTSQMTGVTIRGSFEQVERVIAEYEINTVVHLAAQTQVSTTMADPIGTFEANVQST